MSLSTTLVAQDEEVPFLPQNVEKASKALLAFMKKSKAQPSANNKRSLFDDDENIDEASTPIFLTLTLKRHAKPSLKPKKLVVPTRLDTPDSSICLIVADPQRSYKDLVAHESFPEDLRDRIGKVVGFKKLKAKFSQYEAQRALYAAHDIFLADDRIVNRLPAVLGKTFYKTGAKRPIPIVISAKPEKVDGKKVKKEKKKDGEQPTKIGKPKDVAAEVERAAGAAVLNFTQSSEISVRVGRANFTPEQLAANVDAVARAVIDKHVPQKWKNVRAVFVRGPDTASLPIWQTDELWLHQRDVVPDQAAIEGGEEKAGLLEGPKGLGKKRKAKDERAEDSPAVKKAKQESRTAQEPPTPSKSRGKKATRKELPESEDLKLNKQISERKASLRKQKAAAVAALDD